MKVSSGGITIGDKLCDVELTNIVNKKTTKTYAEDKDKGKAKDNTLESYFAVCFIVGVDRSRYWKYVEDLENNFLIGRYEYQSTINEAYKIIST